MKRTMGYKDKEQKMTGMITIIAKITTQDHRVNREMAR